MAITTYAELQTAVGRWLQRTDLTSVIPDFIANAEAEFNRTLRIAEAQRREEFTVTDQWNSLDTLTDRIAQIRSVRTDFGGRSYPLNYRTPDEIPGYSDSGSPMWWTLSGREIGVFPAPGDSYTLEITYWKSVPPLASHTSNWLLELAPDLYLYRSVLEGAHYTHNTELLARVGPMYERALSQLEADQQRVQFGGTGLQQRVA